MYYNFEKIRGHRDSYPYNLFEFSISLFLRYVYILLYLDSILKCNMEWLSEWIDFLWTVNISLTKDSTFSLSHSMRETRSGIWDFQICFCAYPAEVPRHACGTKMCSSELYDISNKLRKNSFFFCLQSKSNCTETFLLFSLSPHIHKSNVAQIVSLDRWFSNFFGSRRTVKHIKIFWRTSYTKLKIYIHIF
jgi:hypothetical protein